MSANESFDLYMSTNSNKLKEKHSVEESHTFVSASTSLAGAKVFRRRISGSHCVNEADIPTTFTSAHAGSPSMRANASDDFEAP